MEHPPKVEGGDGPLMRSPDVSARHETGGPRRLPRGLHGLSRAEVERSQRDRLLASAAEAVAAKGYAATSVADILAGAGVSRTTFYQLFDDKLDCFMAASRVASGVVASVMAEELGEIEADETATSLEKLDRLLGAYLQTLADNPVLAQVFLIEVYAAGPHAIQQRRESLEQFVDLVIATHRGEVGLLGSSAEQRFAAEVLVGAVSSMVTGAVGAGEAERLVELRAPLMKLASRIIAAGGAGSSS